MSKDYYLLSPNTLEVKDEQGRSRQVTKEELLNTLGLAKNGTQLITPAKKGTLTVDVFKGKIFAEQSAKWNCQKTPRLGHAVFKVKITPEAEKRAEPVYNYNSPSSVELFFEDITAFEEVSLSHRDTSFEVKETDLPSFKMDKNDIALPKVPKKLKPSTIALLNSFALLLISFFAIGFIFSYSGMTGVITAAFVKLGLLDASVGIAMKLAITATVSILLWDACFFALYTIDKLYEFGKRGFKRTAAPSLEDTNLHSEFGPLYDKLAGSKENGNGIDYESLLSTDSDRTLLLSPSPVKGTTNGDAPLSPPAASQKKSPSRCILM